MKDITFCVHGSEDLILLRCQYYPKQSTESVQWCFCRNEKAHRKIHMQF